MAALLSEDTLHAAEQHLNALRAHSSRLEARLASHKSKTAWGEPLTGTAAAEPKTAGVAPPAAASYADMRRSVERHEFAVGASSRFDPDFRDALMQEDAAVAADLRRMRKEAEADAVRRHKAEVEEAERLEALQRAKQELMSAARERDALRAAQYGVAFPVVGSRTQARAQARALEVQRRREQPPSSPPPPPQHHQQQVEQTTTANTAASCVDGVPLTELAEESRGSLRRARELLDAERCAAQQHGRGESGRPVPHGVARPLSAGAPATRSRQQRPLQPPPPPPQQQQPLPPPPQQRQPPQQQQQQRQPPQQQQQQQQQRARQHRSAPPPPPRPHRRRNHRRHSRHRHRRRR